MNPFLKRRRDLRDLLNMLFWFCEKCEMNVSFFTGRIVVGFTQQTMACVSFQSCLLPS